MASEDDECSDVRVLVAMQELNEVVRLALLAVAALNKLYSRPALEQQGQELEKYLTGCAHCERVMLCPSFKDAERVQELEAALSKCCLPPDKALSHCKRPLHSAAPWRGSALSMQALLQYLT